MENIMANEGEKLALVEAEKKISGLQAQIKEMQSQIIQLQNRLAKLAEPRAHLDLNVTLLTGQRQPSSSNCLRRCGAICPMSGIATIPARPRLRHHR